DDEHDRHRHQVGHDDEGDPEPGRHRRRTLSGAAARYRRPRTPGFITPAGSRRCLSACSEATPSGPISPLSHGAWSRPTAWWWVIVAPWASIASRAAPFAARHWSASPPRTWAARTVKYSEAPVG